MTADPSVRVAPLRYTRVAIYLHWGIAALMLVNLVLVWFVDDLPDDWVRPAIDTHKSIGITVLGLVLLRVLWRLGHPPPPLPPETSVFDRVGAAIGHGALYFLMFALPLSGWLHDSAWKDAATHPMSLFWLVPWPRIGWIEAIEPGLKEHLHDVFYVYHRWFGYALYGLFALHVGGALKHQWFDRQPELQRMLP
jgi:cytochrome b561